MSKVCFVKSRRDTCRSQISDTFQDRLTNRNSTLQGVDTRVSSCSQGCLEFLRNMLKNSRGPGFPTRRATLPYRRRFPLSGGPWTGRVTVGTVLSGPPPWVETRWEGRAASLVHWTRWMKKSISSNIGWFRLFSPLTHSIADGTGIPKNKLQ